MSERTILVATDFSVLSGGVVEHAVDVAGMLDAQLVLLSVHAPPQPEAQLHAEMDALEERVRKSGRAVRTVLRRGDPAATIVAVAEELAVELIMMGTHGRHGFSRLAVGSVANEVLQLSRIPVLVVSKRALRAQGKAPGANEHSPADGTP